MKYEDIDLLLSLSREGDCDAKLELVSALNPLLISSIKKFCPIWREYNDLVQDGIIIILECIDIFDPKKGHFLNFVKSYLKYHFLETFKYLLKDENNFSIDDEIDFENFLADDVDIEGVVFEKEISAYLKRAMSLLTKRQREVVIMFYFMEMSLNEIADVLNIKRWTVINTKRRSLEILKEVLNVN